MLVIKLIQEHQSVHEKKQITTKVTSPGFRMCGVLFRLRLFRVPAETIRLGFQPASVLVLLQDFYISADMFSGLKSLLYKCCGRGVREPPYFSFRGIPSPWMLGIQYALREIL